MRVARYLPSVQFSLFIVSILIAGGLIAVADKTTQPEKSTVTLAALPNPSVQTNWRAALDAIQAQQSSRLPAPPNQTTVEAMRAAAESSNVTDSVAKTLLVNLTTAKAQGLGSDTPTQDQLISEAVSQLQRAQVNSYTQKDLAITGDSPTTQRAYGNALALVLIKNASNSYAETMIIIDNVATQENPAELKKLAAIEKEYRTLASDLAHVPVPKTLSPFHLQLVNNFSKMADSYRAIALLLTDPLQGLAGIQQYQTLSQETLKVFISIAQALGKNGILFSKDEPGSAWSTLLSAQ